MIDLRSPNAHQRIAIEQGRRFHEECISALHYAGFEIPDQNFVIADVGIELDAITNNAHGISMPWEFKGSLQGTRPGLMRTDTLKKAIANGYLLQQWENACMFTPLLVMTTHLPKEGSGLAMSSAVKRNIVMMFVDSRDSWTLKRLCNATEKALRRYIEGGKL